MLDIGTGDGRFAYSLAKAEPETFVIGIDANAKPLEKISVKATRKPAKGGAANVIFVQAAAEALPSEFHGTADRIHINFPWGSLLRAVTIGEKAVLDSLRRHLTDGGLLRLIIGFDPERDRSEFDRLGIPDITPAFIHGELLPRYYEAGLGLSDEGSLSQSEWSRLETSWARKLSSNKNRRVIYLDLVAESRT